MLQAPIYIEQWSKLLPSVICTEVNADKYI